MAGCSSRFGQSSGKKQNCATALTLVGIVGRVAAVIWR